MAPRRKDSIQERLTELASKMGAGLLGKLTPFFCLAIIFCTAAIWVLPDQLKIYPFGLGALVVVAYTLISGFIVVAHPILGNLDGQHALEALRDSIKARNPLTIQGSATPVANASPAEGIAGPSKDQPAIARGQGE